jgi:hypothetical protein
VTLKVGIGVLAAFTATVVVFVEQVGELLKRPFASTVAALE